MKRSIKGDETFEDLVFANTAIDGHIAKFGEFGNVGHEVMHKVCYRGKTKFVEVTTNKTQYSAVVMNGKRTLQKLSGAHYSN